LMKEIRNNTLLGKVLAFIVFFFRTQLYLDFPFA
jgi:hypothetical protein